MPSLVRRGKKGSKPWGTNSVAHLDRKQKPLQWMLEVLLPAGLITLEAGRGLSPLHTAFGFRKCLLFLANIFRLLDF